MPTGESRSELAQRIHRIARDAAFRHRNVVRGKVQRPKPLTVELLASDEVLEDDELELTQWVKLYDARVGIRAGDVVTLMREQGAWTVTDVIGDAAVTGI